MTGGHMRAGATPVLALDLGGVVIFRHADPSKGLLGPRPEQAAPVSGALEALAALATIFNSDVVIISRAGPKVVDASLRWLDSHDVWSILGIGRERAHFVRRPAPEMKDGIARSYGVTHFVDDDVKVLAASSARHRFLFSGGSDGPSRAPDLPARTVRANGWTAALASISATVR